MKNKKIYYTLKISKRARSMRLVIHGDGSLVVTKPYWLPKFAINLFLRDKADWIQSKLEYFKKNKRVSIIKNSKTHYLKHREQARYFINSKIREINNFYKFNYRRISIRNQTTRWGSCSQNGNLNFNYKLLFLPPQISEYIITHELCHLKEMNHSVEFWDLVAQTVPDFKKVRKVLKKRGLYFY